MSVTGVANPLPVAHVRPRRKPYPQYRGTGDSTLSRLPQHWNTRRLRFVLSEPLKYGANEPAELSDPNQPRYIRITDVRDDGSLDESTFRSLPDETARPYLLHDGDVLFARSGATVGKTFLYEPSWGRAAYAGYLIRARLRRSLLLPRFLAYFTRSSEYWNWLSSIFIQATIQNVSAEKYANLVVPLPPPDEQAAIAAFLDRETARIDALIAKNQRLIALLQEKRLALIGHVVTKGLFTDVLMKGSGVPWLGDVPDHWHVKRLKFALTFQRGHDLPTSERTEGEVPVVTSAGPSGFHDKAAARGPGIVTGRYGTIGTFHLVQGDYWPLNTTLYSIDLHGNAPRFLWYMLHVLTPVFLVNSAKSAVPGVDRNDLHQVHVAVPPMDEQHAIARHLDDQVRRFEQLAIRVQTAIDKLHEYRSALISAAVTGRIDVGGVAGRDTNGRRAHG